MGILDSWIDNRRKRELERVNRELEELKRHGPDFAKNPHQAPKQHLEGSRRSSTSMLLVGAVFVILVVGIFFFANQRVVDVRQQLTEKETVNAQLQFRVENLTAEVQRIGDQLKTKDVSQSALSSDYAALQKNFTVLELKYDTLNDTLADKDKKISDLQKQVDGQIQQLQDIEDCIENNSISDKDECI